MIIATLALAVATSGTAVAAVTTSHNGETLAHAQTTSLVWSSIILQPSNWQGATRTPKAAVGADGIVHLRGAVLNATGQGTNRIGQLPTTARPTVNIAMTAHTKTGGAIGIIIQNATGYIVLQSPLAPNTYVGLEGITYSR
jgi:hypothetical protein